MAHLLYKRNGQTKQPRNTINKKQMLFGIIRGTYADIRIEHAKRISELNLAGYAIGTGSRGKP